jgi:creatinine amidohydrolase
MKWVELTSTRLAQAPSGTICVLPLGATEQHGPHLPVATDQLIADAITQRVDEACGGRLLILPTLPATCSAHHMAFTGTLSLAHATLISVVSEVLCSAAAHGFRRFFVLNAHGGNMAVGGVIAEQLSSRLPEAEVVFATWFRAAAEQLRPLVEGDFPAVGHACEFETSLVLALRPELVDRSAIGDDGVAPDSPLLRGDLLGGGPTILSKPFDRITRTGVWGKPSLASAEKGEEILSIVVPRICELLAAHWPDAPGLSDAPQV